MSTRIPLHVVEFAAKTNTTDLINAFVDYNNHYKAEILKQPAMYDNSVSFAEKTEKLHNSLDKEISRLSGVADNNFAAEVNRLNPNHNWLLSQ